MYNPPITIKPKIISITLILLLKSSGSIKEAKNAPVLMVTNAIETLDTLMALKKVIQCNAIMIPVNKNFNNDFLSIEKLFFFTRKYTNIKITANNIRYQTRGIASILISAPSIAVNPQINTIR